MPLAISGCFGGNQPGASPIRGRTLAIYSSLPLHGLSAPAAGAVAAGERLALADARDRAGRYHVRFVVLDSTRPGGPLWDPGQVSLNAKRAARDPRAIAYVGELDYGASAVSVPVTNGNGLLQVSPGDGLASLSRTPPGEIGRGGPARYYPARRRTFLRLVPSDLLQAGALLALARQSGAQRLATVTDEGNYGDELGEEAAAEARRTGASVDVTRDFSGDPAAAPSIVQLLAERRPQAVIYAGVAAPGTEALLGGIARRMPGVPVFCASGLAPAGRPPAGVAGAVEVVSPYRPLSTYPAAGRRLLGRLPPSARRVEALYGYEAVRRVLDAIRSTGGRRGATRAAVVRAALAPGARRSPIGRYRVRRGGDVSEDRLAVYRVEHRRLVFDRLVR